MMQKMSRDIEDDEDWGPTIFDESEEMCIRDRFREEWNLPDKKPVKKKNRGMER